MTASTQNVAEAKKDTPEAQATPDKPLLDLNNAAVKRMIKEAMPEIKEVIDTTDHADGKNPYYAPSQR